MLALSLCGHRVRSTDFQPLCNGQTKAAYNEMNGHPPEFSEEVRATDTSAEKLKEQFAACPVSVKMHEEEGKTYAVVRHFTGQKRLGDMITELARERADRETGICGCKN